MSEMVARVAVPDAHAAGAQSSAQAVLPGAAALVFLGSFALLACLQSALLNDPDTQWHVAIGDDILTARAVPWIDTYSHTFAGAPWIAKEWLSQVLMALAHRLAGWAGVAVLSAFAAATTFGLLYHWLARRLDLVPALVATLLPAMLVAPHLLARPHVLAFPVMLIWTCGLVEAAERRAAPRWWLLAVMALWANLHAGFTIGFALAGLLAIEAVIASAPDRRRRVAAHWALFLAGALASACATPYGYAPLWVTVTLFGSGEPLRYITEWQPLERDGAGLLAMALIGLDLAVLARRPRANAIRLVLVALLAGMTLRHGRFLDLLALLTPVIAAGPIARFIPRLAAPRNPNPPHRAAMSVTVLLGLVIAAVGLVAHPQPNASVTPEAALAAARAQGLTDGRVYNSYDFGGFLIARGIRTFIDGRSDQIFLGGFTHALHAAAAADEPGPLLGLLARRDVSWALVQTGSGEARLLAAAPGWRNVHTDDVAQVFALR